MQVKKNPFKPKKDREAHYNCHHSKCSQHVVDPTQTIRADSSFKPQPDCELQSRDQYHLSLMNRQCKMETKTNLHQLRQPEPPSGEPKCSSSIRKKGTLLRS